MLEKSLATLFALLILATLINRFLLWRLPERKGVRLHYVFVPGGASSFVFTGDFRSTLDDVDVFCADKFSGIERILYAYIHTFSAVVILGYSS